MSLLKQCWNCNVITDFTSGEDVIGIAGFGISFNDVDLTQLGDDALVGTDGINFALLQNVDINDLSASDFALNLARIRRAGGGRKSAISKPWKLNEIGISFFCSIFIENNVNNWIIDL